MIRVVLLFILAFSTSFNSAFAATRSRARTCDAQLSGPVLSSSDKKLITKSRVSKIIERLKTPLAPGQHGIRILTDEKEETPDPDRPMRFTLPNGRQTYMIGFSGQKAVYVDDLKKFFHGGVTKAEPIKLFNGNGFQYGVELDEKGQRIHYAHNSSLWDIYAVPYRKADGAPGIKIFAGGMADYTKGEKAGQPLVPADGYMTRQRLFFDGEFVNETGTGETSSIGYTLIGSAPKAVLNRLTPRQGRWIRNDKRGVGFQHGYGGGPVTLANGELFTTPEGWVPFVHESVVEQKTIKRADGTKQVLPFLTVQSVTYLDPTLSKVMAPTQTIWSPIRPDGTVYKSALRTEWNGSPLTEGLHVNPMANGQPIGSSEELAAIRARGEKITLDGMHSHGEYYGEYGGSGITFEEDFSNPQPIVDDQGEIEDFLKPLSPIFAWRGRPCSTFIDGQEYVLAHAVDRSKIPAGIVMNRMPQKGEDWVHFNRQIIAFPVERYTESGRQHIRIKDNTGLLEELAQYQAPDAW